MTDNTPGRLLGDRYRLSRRIGRGGAGEVWRATDSLLDRDVALKILHRHLIGDDEAIDRFRREAVTAAGLNHRNIVVIHDIAEQDQDVYLVMELIDGPTLAGIVRRSAPLDPDVVVAIAEQVAQGLGAAHEQGLVHRDVKPANVLLTSDGTAKVADFGIAKALGEAHVTLTKPGEVVGTASYLAPEQLGGEDVDQRADVYSLGLVIHEALTAERAFGGETVTEVAVARFSAPEVRPRDVRSDLPQELDDVVARATSQDLNDRFANGTEFAQALAEFAPAQARRMVADLVAGTTTDSGSASEPGGSGTQVLPADRNGRERSGAGRDAGDRDGSTTRAVASAERHDAPDADAEDGTPRSWAWVPVALVGLVALVLVVQALSGNGGGGGDGGGEEPPTIAVANGTDLDPLGDDREEHREDVPKAFDGDPQTEWMTERYDGADLGGLKDGVGIAFELAEARAVDRVRLQLASPGIHFSLYAMDSAPQGGPDGWGEPIATIEGADETTEIPVDGAEATHWVVWITQLREGGGRARIAEITFLAR
ncbi:MAG: serine/threonine protein kinase [Actinobacteria bacterium]|nr:serine/threonine protein kinase [Actinomycetota bacterium]